MYAIGGNFAVVFRYLGDINTSYGVFGLFMDETVPTSINFTEHSEGTSFDLDIKVNVNMPSSHFLETVKLAYEQQSVKKWLYGVVEVTS